MNRINQSLPSPFMKSSKLSWLLNFHFPANAADMVKKKTVVDWWCLQIRCPKTT